MNPKDNYVAEFVRGLSKAELLDARSLMAPLPEPADRPDGVTVAPGENLDALVRKIIGQDLPLTVVENGMPIGVIDKDTILQAVGRTDD